MSWKVILKSLKNSDMRNRLLAVLGMLVVFRIMAHIPIPLGDTETLQQVLKTIFTTSQQSQFLSFIDVLSGGALANFSIMLVGLGPYINASIIFQLLTKAIPQLEALQKEGEFGRRKINQYTRMLTFPLAIIQSIGAIYLVKQTAQQLGGVSDITANATTGDWVLMVAALTGGAMILMWLGELITEKGVGNGISLLITVGIVSTLPSTIANSVSGLFDKTQNFSIFGWGSLPINGTQLKAAGILFGATIIVTVIVVLLNEARRALTINYAKRVQGNRAYGGVTTTLPVKLITAGVIPVIFAVAFLSVPQFAGQLMLGSESLRLQQLGQNLSTWFQTPTAEYFASGGFQPYIYPIVYFLLVFVFTFFYTSITFNAKEIAENLQKQGGFIADVRSGLQTEKYLTKVVNRLTLFGAFALGLLAITPIIGQIFLKSNIAIGGTSILILVAVALETLRAIESRALMVTYDQYEQPDYFRDDVPEAKKKKGLTRLKLSRKKRNKQ
jgi:preprotein translocase subunit SecY